MTLQALVALVLLATAFLLGRLWERRQHTAVHRAAHRSQKSAKIKQHSETKAKVLPFTRPLGYWRCTHAADWAQKQGFIPGEIYICKEGPSGNIRIYPFENSTWAPYWEPKQGRFCYPDKDMAFTYLGSVKPASFSDQKAA